MIRRVVAVLMALAAIAGVATRVRADQGEGLKATRASAFVGTPPMSRAEIGPAVAEIGPAVAEVTTLARPIAVAPLDDATRGTAELVGTTMPDPNPLPAESGTGRRAVFSISQQFVWVVEADGSLVRSFLVSARLDMPRPGTYHVFSKSEYACSRSNWNECMRWMIRFTKGPEGDNIGFHEIPRIKGVPVQDESQLGQPLSSGCLRESTADAWFMWLWTSVGTTVVVLP